MSFMQQLLGGGQQARVAGPRPAADWGSMAGGTAQDLGEALPTVHRQYRQYRYRSEP